MKNLLLIATIFIGIGANANDCNFLPPDSTANIIEKSAGGIAVSEGRAFLNEGNVRQALLKFREAIKKDKKNAMGHYYLGECNFLLKRYEKALQKAEDAYKLKPDVSNEVHYLMARSQQALGKYEDAVKNYTKTLEVLAKSKQRLRDLRVNGYLAQCNYAISVMKNTEKPVEVKLLSGEINSIYPQYGLIWADSIAYFTSRRPDTKGGGINPSDNIYYEDIYGATWNESTKSYDKISNEISKINSNNFESFSYISKDGFLALMTVNNEMAQDKPKYKTGSSDIFYAKKSKRGTWNAPRPYGKNINTSFYEGNAVISADGETMYYVSERKGGKGQSDIWMAEKLKKDWNKPVNLGDSINTPYRETTPWISPDGKYLFFSSQGHDENMGGYDIFVSKKGQNGFEKAVNLGVRINSSTDDFYFRIVPGKKQGHMSRVVIENGQGLLKILEVNLENLNVEELTKKK
jgi:tetratricopeptide (TPR) repeat protein